MTREIIAKHNTNVSIDDIVWHLGDFAINTNLVQPILSQLNGDHHLIIGNHDACCPGYKYKNKKSIIDYYSYGFRTVTKYQVLNLVKIGKVLLHHLSLKVENSKYSFKYNPSQQDLDRHDVKYLFHGHTYDKNKIRNNCVNVGVDAWDFTLVSENQLANVLFQQSQ